jgi:hypothetical protein
VISCCPIFIGRLGKPRCCRSRGFTRIILEGDSLIVVNALNTADKNWCNFGQILADIYIYTQAGTLLFSELENLSQQRREFKMAQIAFGLTVSRRIFVLLEFQRFNL